MSEYIRVLLCYEDEKRIVNLQANAGDVVATLRAKAANLFLSERAETSMRLQYYDKEFEEWVDVDEDFIPVNKQRIKVLTAAPAHSRNGSESERDDAVVSVLASRV